MSDTPVGAIALVSPRLPAAAAAPFVTPTMFGVVIVGEAPKTFAPVPVSSLSTAASCALVVDANCDRLPVVAAGDAKFALSHGVAALNVGRTENVCAAAQVFAPFSSGIVAPLVPVLTVAAVPRPRFVRAAEADVPPVPPLAIASVPLMPVNGAAPHTGAVLGPVEMMACPVVEPAGFRSDGGVVVAASAANERSAASAPKSILLVEIFMVGDY